ncbi:hypothetical protein PC9H_008112 [Pleurotus ostreatus]|uniref:Uncharacterized protein n=2 Tax=Pleurotus ostreatus TaxID=5322 RepID=A0A067NMZ8_PLEO1|nr:uncharacterized protein PC9H_008112 [Pleurotus ostreatus]KAF7428880.1 hypothetical protein PC9H_008112 [Pleurotus ostreatus]KAJ8697121.1 hypothetical protein PTI98_006927 [Pleurotus ostreatus]KDQ28355.1 hypothetical protein PLEOSDRAFT_167825 [Pleurotus ostreatus PC15]
MSSAITFNEPMISPKDRVAPSKLSIEALLIAEPMDASPPPNTPATAALEEYGQESMLQARRFLMFKPREFLPALKICTGMFLPDDQPIMAAPPNSPTTSHRAKFEDEEEMALLPWAVALKASGLDGGEEVFHTDYPNSSNLRNPSQVLSPANSVFTDDGSSTGSGDEATGGC